MLEWKVIEILNTASKNIKWYNYPKKHLIS